MASQVVDPADISPIADDDKQPSWTRSGSEDEDYDTSSQIHDDDDRNSTTEVDTPLTQSKYIPTSPTREQDLKRRSSMKTSKSQDSTSKRTNRAHPSEEKSRPHSRPHSSRRDGHAPRFRGDDNDLLSMIEGLYEKVAQLEEQLFYHLNPKSDRDPTPESSSSHLDDQWGKSGDFAERLRALESHLGLSAHHPRTTNYVDDGHSDKRRRLTSTSNRTTQSDVAQDSSSEAQGRQGQEQYQGQSGFQQRRLNYSNRFHNGGRGGRGRPYVSKHHRGQTSYQPRHYPPTPVQQDFIPNHDGFTTYDLADTSYPGAPMAPPPYQDPPTSNAMLIPNSRVMKRSHSDFTQGGSHDYPPPQTFRGGPSAMNRNNNFVDSRYVQQHAPSQQQPFYHTKHHQPNHQGQYRNQQQQQHTDNRFNSGPSHVTLQERITGN